MSDEDKELWRFINKDTTPFPGKEIKESELELSRTLKEEPLSLPTTAKEEPKRNSPPAPLSVGNLSGVDAATARKLQRGQLTPSATLDVHGMSRDQAHDALNHFIHHARGNHRCVLVITGKGSKEKGTGVIRESLSHWINTPTLRAHIVAVTPAPPQMGGSGAFVFLLKTKR